MTARPTIANSSTGVRASSPAMSPYTANPAQVIQKARNSTA